MDDVNPLEAIKAYLEKADTGKKDIKGEVLECGSFMIRFKLLTSGRAGDSLLKVRQVLQSRLLDRAADLKNGFGTSFSLSVRLEEDGTYTVFDGNHRYHAIKHLMELDASKYTEETKIPCVVYKSTLPDILAMQYAQILNDIQLCASGATAMDFMRFLKNHATRVRSTHEGDLITAQTIFKSMQRFFVNSHVGVERAKLTYTKSCLTFLKQLGDEAFAEAERLMEFDAAKLYKTIQRLLGVDAGPGSLTHGCALPDTDHKCGKFDTPKRCCFMPESAFIFSGKCFGKELSATEPHPPGVAPGILWVRIIWASWIVSGGKTITQAEATALKQNMVTDMQAWPTPPTAVAGGAAESKQADPPRCDFQEDVQALPPTYVVEQNGRILNTLFEEQGEFAPLDIAETPEMWQAALLALTHAYACTVPCDPKEGAATSLMPNIVPALGHLVNVWNTSTTAKLAERGDEGGTVLETLATGLSFMGTLSKLGAHAKEIRESKARVELLAAEQRLRRAEAARKAQEKQKKHAAHLLERAAERVVAEKARTKEYNKCFDDVAADFEAQEKSKEQACGPKNALYGLGVWGYACCHLPTTDSGSILKTDDCCDAPLVKGLQNAASLFVDLMEHTAGDEGAYIKTVCENWEQLSAKKTSGSPSPTAHEAGSTVMVLLRPSQLLAVMCALGTTPYKKLEPLFHIGSSWNAFTLGDKAGNGGEWGLHPTIDNNCRSGQPTGTPIAYIITARIANTVLGPELKCWKAGGGESLKSHQELYCPVPKWCVRERYRFEHHISRDWRRDVEACADFPWSLALATFFYWHTRPNDILVFDANGSLRRRPASLVALYMSRRSIYVNAVTSGVDLEGAARAHNSVAFLSAKKQKRCVKMCLCVM